MKDHISAKKICPLNAKLKFFRDKIVYVIFFKRKYLLKAKLFLPKKERTFKRKNGFFETHLDLGLDRAVVPGILQKKILKNTVFPKKSISFTRKLPIGIKFQNL